MVFAGQAYGKNNFSIYFADVEALALGSTIMIFVAAVSFPEVHAMICAGILRGNGKTSQVIAYSFVSITILRSIITAILVHGLNLGLLGAWTSLFIDQTIRAACSSFLVVLIMKKKPQLATA